ncbi:hypothetical protein MOF32_13860 [Priestia megaterium]|uniref:hypothetical protein n=1 Tax=Priestia megaterium TaxID=1404 RepID=UPI002281C360|nr:hypothetical protein [Priestia megaterium]MCY9024026.1 hypothetical protein [Priestia megaterium]
MLRVEEAILLAVAILLILLGMYLWRKGDSKESFWETVFNVIGDVLVWDLPVFLLSVLGLYFYG